MPCNTVAVQEWIVVQTVSGIAWGALVARIFPIVRYQDALIWAITNTCVCTKYVGKVFKLKRAESSDRIPSSGSGEAGLAASCVRRIKARVRAAVVRSRGYVIEQSLKQAKQIKIRQKSALVYSLTMPHRELGSCTQRWSNQEVLGQH
jgi:hypothetical protein